MQFKPVPEPPTDRTLLATVCRTLPATASDVDDCCQHLIDETPLETRRRGSLFCARSRSRTDSDTPDDLEQDELERADGSLTANEVAAAIQSERQQSGDWRRRSNRDEKAQRERVERLLEWAVLLGLAEKPGDGYRAAPARG
ncbi:hypothetical protein [Natrinema sp. SYSU A 869]|uniref:hypothetical protein n=1 Tax=Natrinema sp. SYSU A 869 TaxID=2871694 RepID=UPI0031F2EA75